jgi:phage terminase large subunit
VRVQLPNNWQPRDYQLPAWTYLENGGLHAELVWHRRSGKDEVALHRTACAAFERVAGYWYMLPEYKQARKAIWDAINPHTGLRRIDEAFPHELRSVVRHDEMYIRFKNGSSWQVVGSDNPNSLVGAPPAGIVYSEWALSNPSARAYLRPILAENNGWQIFNTTPRGRNHAYTTLKSAEKIMLGGGDAFAQVLDATQTGVFTPERLEIELRAYIADFGEDYGRAKFEQEYLCSFEAANLGAILARALGIAEKNGRISDEIDFDPYGAPLEISADIGRRDTATWWFWQSRVGGHYVVDHDSGWGIDAEEWCQRLRARLDQYRLEGRKTPLGRIWLPHDARAKTFAAKRSAVEIFVEHFGSEHVAITPQVSVADRVNAARVMVGRTAFNATKCEKGLNALRAWSYKYDDDKKTFSSEPEHDWASHDGDGYSYGCVIVQQLEPPPPKPPPMRGLAVGVPSVSLEEMWADAKPKRERF